MDSSLVPPMLTQEEKILEFTSPASSDSINGTLDVDLRSHGMFKLYGIWAIAFLSNFFSGYGVASLVAINAMSQYQNFFDFGGLGVSTGLVFSLWPIAACATFWLGPILSDRFGRRGGMLTCSLIFILGTVLLACAKDVAMLLCGRFFVGAAVGMLQPAVGPYLTELSPPKIRGIVGGLSNVSWISGNILATGICICTLQIGSTWAWRAPWTIQLLAPAILALSCMFLPESPRWLYANGRPDEAEKVLIDLHGNGQMTDFVKMEIEQLKRSLVTVPKRWDYKVLVKNRAARYRTMLAIMMGIFGQLSGSGFTFFLPYLYRQVGVTGVRPQLLMTLAASLVSLFGAVVGSWQTDRLGRRKALVSGTFACAVTLACAMGCSAASGVKTDGEAATNQAASKAAIAFIIIFGGVYAWCYQPLLGLYPTECLAMDQRSTGMGCMVLALNTCSFINQFAIPVAIKKIGWWTYLPYICWDVFETAAWYFLAVETKNRTLEEIDTVFCAANPVKASKSASAPWAPLPEGVTDEDLHVV